MLREGRACVSGIENYFFFSICNQLLLSSTHFKMENRNNFIKAIKKIKTEDTAHSKSDVGKVNPHMARNEVIKGKTLHMLKSWQY